MTEKDELKLRLLSHEYGYGPVFESIERDFRDAAAHNAYNQGDAGKFQAVADILEGLRHAARSLGVL